DVANYHAAVICSLVPRLEVCRQSWLNSRLIAGPQSDFGGVYGELFSAACTRFVCCDDSIFRGGDCSTSASPNERCDPASPAVGIRGIQPVPSGASTGRPNAETCP